MNKIAYYKSIRIVNGKPKWVITDRNSNIVNRTPTNDQLKLAIPEEDSPKIRRCCLCQSHETYIRKNDIQQWHKYKCDKYNCSRYLCDKCYKRDPNSYHGIIKSMADHRNKRLGKDSTTGKGFIGQQVIAKIFVAEDCNINTNNFHSIIDVYDSIKYKRIQVKTVSFSEYGRWTIGHILYNFDTLIIICMSNDFKNIERVYIIPAQEIKNRNIKSVSIYRSVYRNRKKPWYENFRVDQRPYNRILHNMKIEDCPVLDNGKK